MSPRRLATGLAGAAAVISLITLAARVVGFGRWLVYSHTVSGLCVGNAYSAANQVPNVLYEVVAGGALAGAVVPLLAGPLGRMADHPDRSRAQVDQISSALLTWTLLVLVPVAVLLTALAGPLAGTLVDEAACPGGTQLAARFLRVFAPQVVLYGIGVVLTGILTAKHRFVGPALAPLLSSLTVIAAYLTFGWVVGPSRQVRADPAALPAVGEALLAWGTTAGVAVMTLPLLWPVLRSGVRLRPTLHFPSGVAARARSLAGAGVAALMAQQASVVAVLMIQRSSGDPATLNIFQYTQAVYLLPYAVLVVPLATAAFPRLSRHAALAERPEFARAAATTTRVVVLISFVAAGLLIAVSGPVADFFGALDRADVQVMAPALAAMAPGLVGFALIAHLSRALYALERGRAAATATVAGWLVVVVAMTGFAFLLPGRLAAVALTAGNTVGMSVAAVALLVAMRRAAGSESLDRVPASLVTGLVAGTAGAAAGWVCAGPLGDWLAARVTSALLGALATGLAAGVVALTVAGAVLLAGDRDTVRLVLRRGR